MTQDSVILEVRRMLRYAEQECRCKPRQIAFSPKTYGRLREEVGADKWRIEVPWNGESEEIDGIPIAVWDIPEAQGFELRM